MYGKFRCVVQSVKPEQQNQIMEILQDKVRLLQNFPQKVVLDTKKTKLSLIHIHINSEQWDQSNEYSDIITCMNIEIYYVWTFKCMNIQMYARAIGSVSHLNIQTIKYCDI